MLLKGLQPKHRLLVYSLSGGLLLWLGWPTKPLPFLLLLGFVPLLLLEHEISLGDRKRQGKRFFRHAYLLFLVWNLLSTYWVCYSTVPGGIAAIVLNALLMCIPALLFYWTKRVAGNLPGYASFVIYWIGFEYAHLNWDLSWPWLTLGNGFASLPSLVQWYEYTGHLGGSLWILLVNLLVFLGMRHYPRLHRERLLGAAALAVLPMIFSLARYFTYQEQGEPVEVVVVQPNVDPYNEKFSSAPNFIPYEEQLGRLLQLSNTELSPNTRFLLWPETSLVEGYWEHDIQTYSLIQRAKDFVAEHPGLHLIAGIDTYKHYKSKDEATPTVRYREQVGYYDVFNTALHINDEGQLALYHKSKLVPGVEKLPYPGFFAFLGPMAIDLGGTVGSLGSQPERSVFAAAPGLVAAPVICYESIYGDFVSQYVRNGASFIAIITNDAWWSDSPGYRQHLQYASLRAIENRRSIARSANTGISGFLNQRGDILARSGWWVPAALRHTIMANTTLTLYSRFGDYIGRGCSWLTLPLFLLSAAGFLKRRRRVIKN